MPLASRNDTSVDGNGSPIDPVKSGRSIGVTETVGEHSVSPYPSAKGDRVSACQRSATARWIAVPPPTDTLSAEKSSFSNPGSFNKLLKSVLTPGKVTKRYFDNTFRNALVSRGSATRTPVPPISSPLIARLSAKM